jgi:hypothetical protein
MSGLIDVSLVKPKLPWYDFSNFKFVSNASASTKLIEGTVILVLFGIIVTVAIVLKLTMGAKTVEDLKKKNPYDEIFNNWIQTVLMFVGLDIGGAVSGYLTSGSIDFWNIAVSGSCRNTVFLIFQIIKTYFIQKGPLAA